MRGCKRVVGGLTLGMVRQKFTKLAQIEAVDTPAGAFLNER
jgi:hypothetical protein